MKRILSLLVLLLACGNASSLRAQEAVENELDLVRKLRAKGWNDLARSRIDELLKRNDPALNALLPYESARINIAEARQKDPDQRLALFNTARDQLQDFIAKNQGKPQAALARVELARVTSYQGQAILSKAMHEDDRKERHAKARPAEAKFIEAGKEIEVAITALEAAIKDAGPDVKKSLEHELTQARFDIAVNLFDQARTYIDTSGDIDLRLKRSVTVTKAKDEFFKLRKDESSEVGWLANAWLMKCNMELDTPVEVRKYHDLIIKRKDDKTANPGIQPAVRLVRYFAMQDATSPREDSETIGSNAIGDKAKKAMKDRLHDVQKEGEAWLKSYGSYLKTYEGQGVRFETAQAYLTEARGEENEAVNKIVDRLDKDKGLKGTAKDVESAIRSGEFDQARAALEKIAKDGKNDKILVAFKKLIDDGDLIKKITGPAYDKAAFHFDKLADTDGDLAERGRQVSNHIKFKRLDIRAELKTYEEYIMKARIERNLVVGTSDKLAANSKKVADAKGDAAKLAELAKEKANIDAERKKYLKNVVSSLNRAVALATPKQNVEEARYLLSGAYLALGDPYRAAIVAESIGRARGTRRAPESAATAIATYASLFSSDPNNAVVKARLEDMANFALSEESQRTWKTEVVTSLAHYHLGMAVRESDPKKAITHLEGIDKSFDGYLYAQAQLVFIAEAARQKIQDDKNEQKWFLDAARRAIARLPKFDAKHDSPTVIVMYFYAKLEQSKYMYSEAMEELKAADGELKAVKKCAEMKSYVLALSKELEPLPGGIISPVNREQLDFTIQVMLKYADLGSAESKFRSDRAGRYDEVLEATKTVVKDMLEKAKTPGNIKLKDYRVTGDILGLALRASVQKGDVEKGRAILDVLQRLSDLEDNKSGNVVASLLNDIAGQIDTMKKNKDTKGLDATRKSYTGFLDEIANEYEKKGFDNNTALMLAQAYKSLELPSKAATLLSKYKAPANLDKKVVKGKAPETEAETKERQAWEEDVGRYWSVQIDYIRTLRTCKDKDSLDNAAKAADALIKHDNARYKIQAKMEKNLILEEQQRYREAWAEWSAFMKIPSIGGNNLTDKNIQKIYFPAYFYNARTLYKVATLDPKIKDRQKLIEAAANMIIKLEYAKSKDGWEIAGPMFQELLKEKDAEQLKKVYDVLKAGKKGASLSDSPRDAQEPRPTASVSMLADFALAHWHREPMPVALR